MSGDSQTGMAAPQAVQGSTAFDVNNPLAYYQTQANNPFTYSYNPASTLTQGQGDSGDGPVTYNSPGYMQSSNGRALELGANNIFTDTFDKPGGQSEREKVDVQYQYDPATGKTTAVNAANRYQGSDWTEQYRTPVAILGSVLAAGAGGAALAGGGASAGGAAAGNGAFLGEGVASGIPAWDAAYTGAGGVLGGGSGAALAGGGTGFLNSLRKGDFGGALTSAGSNLVDYASTPKGLQTLISLGTGLVSGIGGGSGGGSGSGSGSGSGTAGRPVNTSPTGFWSQLDAGKRPQATYAPYKSTSAAMGGTQLSARPGSSIGGK